MNKKTKGYIFILISIIAVSVMSFIAFTLKNNARIAKKKEPWTFSEFLNNGEKVSLKTSSCFCITTDISISRSKKLKSRTCAQILVHRRQGGLENSDEF